MVPGIISVTCHQFMIPRSDILQIPGLDAELCRYVTDQVTARRWLSHAFALDDRVTAADVYLTSCSIGDCPIRSLPT